MVSIHEKCLPEVPVLVQFSVVFKTLITDK